MTAAIGIADREGFEAVSMRRVARELGVGAMTLYHHVADKDELVELMADAIGAEMLVPEPFPDGWRAAMGAIAHRTRDTFERHPWLIRTVGEYSHMTLNGLRHIEQSLRAVSELGEELGGRVLFAADEYTFGFVLRDVLIGGPEGGEERFSVPARLQEAIDSGELPLISRWLASGGRREQPADRFEVGLEALFDGFEALRARSRP
ncbi:MAG TPA: TetR/AcrR family transcriptional regulator [Gaiellaceae bacterium]